MRQPDDFYCTPDWCIDLLFNKVPLPPSKILEPCAGSGAIKSKLLHHGHTVDSFEIDSDRALQSQSTCADFLKQESKKEYDYIVTNPPYKFAFEFVKKGLEFAPISIYLLRLSFLESGTRKEFLQQYTPDVYVLSKRPSFVNGRTDSCAYAWFVFYDKPRSDGKVVVV